MLSASTVGEAAAWGFTPSIASREGFGDQVLGSGFTQDRGQGAGIRAFGSIGDATVADATGSVWFLCPGEHRDFPSSNIMSDDG